jgi:hypothetical protein
MRSPDPPEPFEISSLQITPIIYGGLLENNPETTLKQYETLKLLPLQTFNPIQKGLNLPN